jgi:hypothetical protein
MKTTYIFGSLESNTKKSTDIWQVFLVYMLSASLYEACQKPGIYTYTHITNLAHILDLHTTHKFIMFH